MNYLSKVAIFAGISLTLSSCKAVRTCEKSSFQSETASFSSSRLTFNRTLDSLSRQRNLSIDSIAIVFPSAVSLTLASSMEEIKKPPPHISPAGKASRFAQSLRPQVVKVYGLHLNENIEKKSLTTADLKDSVKVFTQSEKCKSSTKQRSKPSNSPKYIFYILLLGITLYIFYRFRPAH